MAKEKVLIIDFNHIAHTYMWGAKPLSTTVNLNGVDTVVQTTVLNYATKLLHKWCNKGYTPMAVCLDRPCGCRKQYFNRLNAPKNLGEKGEYKGTRDRIGSGMLEEIQLTSMVLYNSGVSVYAQTGYEADDLVQACVAQAKKQYPDRKIEIVTGDSDLLGLVEDNVSVFLRSRKTTFAFDKADEKTHYIEVTPENYQEVVESLSTYKNLKVPYNSIVLTKLLRGDKSDNILGKPDWKPKMYNQLIDILQNNEDISKIGRYGVSEEKYIRKGTGIMVQPNEVSKYRPYELEYLLADKDANGNPITAPIIIQRGTGVYESEKTEGTVYGYSEPQELTYLCEVLGKYVEDSDIEHIRGVYNGLNLNNFFWGLGNFDRKPARVEDIHGYNMATLANYLREYMVNI